MLPAGRRRRFSRDDGLEQVRERVHRCFNWGFGIPSVTAVPRTLFLPGDGRLTGTAPARPEIDSRRLKRPDPLLGGWVGCQQSRPSTRRTLAVVEYAQRGGQLDREAVVCDEPVGGELP